MDKKDHRWLKLFACILLGLGVAQFPPEGVPVQSWHIFACFLATVCGLILRPLPMGPLVILALVTLAGTKTLGLKEVLSGYGDTTVWLVVSAFLIAGAVVNTGFGRRVALTLVVRLGKSMRGLAYALCSTELILGPVVPSNTARGGGILAPIVRSLAGALGSLPEKEPRKAGAFLVLVGAHANLITAAMFLTGMAANPLVAKAANDVFGTEFSWGTWALGSIVPGLLGLLLLPLLLERLYPAELTDVAPARAQAEKDLQEMGPWSRNEKIMGLTFVVLITLWMTKPIHGMGTTIVALIGVCILFLTEAEDWQAMVQNHRAWDTLIWLGGLLAMANALKNHGFVTWLADTLGALTGNMGALTVVIVLALVYFYSMYAFSMLTAHISAFVAAFFAVALAAGAPPMLTIAIMAYFSNLCACTTNYSTGPVVIYFGLGYVPPNRWFLIGAVIALFHLSIWLTIGMGWWKLLGWW